MINPVIKVGNLDSLRTIADVRDAVNAYFLLVTNDLIPKGSVFNIGGSFTASVREILEKLISLSTVKNISHEIDPNRIRPIDADLQVPDTSKFYNHIKWKPKFTFEKTMLDLLNYWRQKVKNSNFLDR